MKLLFLLFISFLSPPAIWSGNFNETAKIAKTSNKLINLTNRQSRHDRDTQQNPRTNISFVLEKQKPTLESEFTLLLELTNKEKDDRTPLDVDFLMKYLRVSYRTCSLFIRQNCYHLIN